MSIKTKATGAAEDFASGAAAASSSISTTDAMNAATQAADEQAQMQYLQAKLSVIKAEADMVAQAAQK